MTKTNTSDFLNLEPIDDPQALAWVHDQNNKTFAALTKRPEYTNIEQHALKLLNATDRIPYGFFRDTHIYNFWQDENHKRGLWRRCSRESYYSGNPRWETLLDIDELGKKENQSWVFKGTQPLHRSTRTLLMLSPGGGDAVDIREFDLEKKAFVANGFHIPTSKNTVEWIDKDTLAVGVATSAEDSTDSGYPRIQKIWKRGESLAQAKPIFEGKKEDTWTYTSRLESGNKHIFVVSRGINFFTSEKFVWNGKHLVTLKVPNDSEIVSYFQGSIVVRLKSAWKFAQSNFTEGSLVAIATDEHTGKQSTPELVLAPTPYLTIDGASASPNALYVSILDNVRSKVLRMFRENNRWKAVELALPELGTISIESIDTESDNVLLSYENFVTPSTLYLYDGSKNTLKPLYSLPRRFDSNAYLVEQHFAKSFDGTSIPYFQISPRGNTRGENTPTLLYGYGGFEVSMQPNYASQVENGWLSAGGSYVLANIRGGGEFGPAWHKAALREKRQVAFNDFIAVAEDLVARKVTSPAHLGIMGGSNGGLLVGAVMTQRPDLFNAVVIQVPLLDMMRFHKLLAGASWMAEYGNPDDPNDAKFIRQYSPFQNVTPDKKYPHVFLMTSTRDDRVHPSHARRMAAKLESFGQSVLYYENTEGGHGGSADYPQLARWYALEYTFLRSILK